MPRKLFGIETKGRITQFCLSDDWKSRIPWEHKGEALPYFAARRDFSDCLSVSFTYLYAGPIAMISARMIEQ